MQQFEYIIENIWMQKITFSSKSTLEVLSGVWINLTSVYFGALLISPGIFGSTNSFETLKLLLSNLPSAILSFVIAIILTEKAKNI